MEELMIWRRFAASGGWWQVKIEDHMTLQELLLLLLLLEKTVSRITLWGEQHDVVCIEMALLVTKGNKQPRSCTIAGLWCCILSASHKAINNNPRALRYAQAWEAWGFYHWGFNLQWIQQSEFWSDAAWMLSQCLIDEFWRKYLLLELWIIFTASANHQSGIILFNSISHLFFGTIMIMTAKTNSLCTWETCILESFFSGCPYNRLKKSMWQNGFSILSSIFSWIL